MYERNKWACPIDLISENVYKVMCCQVSWYDPKWMTTWTFLHIQRIGSEGGKISEKYLDLPWPEYSGWGRFLGHVETNRYIGKFKEEQTDALELRCRPQSEKYRNYWNSQNTELSQETEINQRHSKRWWAKSTDWETETHHIWSWRGSKIGEIKDDAIFFRSTGVEDFGRIVVSQPDILIQKLESHIYRWWNMDISDFSSGN